MTRFFAALWRQLQQPGLLLRKAWWLVRRRWLACFRTTTDFAREVEFCLHWVSPREIEYRSLVDSHVDLDRGRVRRGKWDDLVERFDRFDYYAAYREVLAGDAEWVDTTFYHRVLSQIEAGQPKWGCHTRKEFDHRLEYVTSLFEEMREFGYVPNHNTEQITVDVGRHGDLLFVDGQHRLSFARLLDLPAVPILLLARHPQWTRFKREIIRYALRHRGRVRDPLLHPDLEDIQAEFGEKRFELIQRSLKAQGGRLLDLNSHWGYFCHRFEDLGFACTAVEPDGVNQGFLMRLRRARGKQFELCKEPALAFLERVQEEQKPSYDVVLALGLFDDPTISARGRKDYEQLFAYVKTQELYVMHRPPANISLFHSAGRWTFREAEFIEFARTASRFDDITCVGHVEDGLPVYRLGRSPA